MEKYLTLKGLQGHKRKTISDYGRLYRTHLLELAEKPIAEITLGDVQAIQYRLVSEGKHRTAEQVVLLTNSTIPLKGAGVKGSLWAVVQELQVLGDTDRQ